VLGRRVCLIVFAGSTMSSYPGGSRRFTGAFEATSSDDDYGGGIVGTLHHNDIYTKNPVTKRGFAEEM
jgi:hypothetical protein